MTVVTLRQFSVQNSSIYISYIFRFQANDGRKKTGSTEGMRRTVQTSRLMQYRIRESVGLRIDSMMQVQECKLINCRANVD